MAWFRRRRHLSPEDEADLALVAERMATDNGNRTPLADVMTQLGITQADIDALPDDADAKPLTMDELRLRYSTPGARDLESGGQNPSPGDET